MRAGLSKGCEDLQHCLAYSQANSEVYLSILKEVQRHQLQCNQDHRMGSSEIEFKQTVFEVSRGSVINTSLHYFQILDGSFNDQISLY